MSINGKSSKWILFVSFVMDPCGAGVSWRRDPVITGCSNRYFILLNQRYKARQDEGDMRMPIGRINMAALFWRGKRLLVKATLFRGTEAHLRINNGRDSPGSVVA